uniref:SKP1 component dimerisation domain-containing protein n=1 Tax=Solanum lycopersicum TaxID=4081 RepID=A0A3Q7GQF0_SOLLC
MVEDDCVSNVIPLPNVHSVSKDMFIDFDKAFVKVHHSIFKGKTPKDILKKFNIKNDFTPEKEENIPKENT